MKRRQFVGAGLALAATWPIRGFTSVLKGVGDLPAKTLAGGDVVLPGSSIEAFAASLRGDLLMQGSEGYDSTRRVWNAHVRQEAGADRPLHGRLRRQACRRFRARAPVADRRACRWPQPFGQVDLRWRAR